MKFFLAVLAWVFIGAVLGTGIWLFAVKGMIWPMVVATIALITAIGKIGCATH